MLIHHSNRFVLVGIFISACQLTKPAPQKGVSPPTKTNSAQETLQDWQLESHQAGQLHWTMSAQSATHLQNTSHLNQWHWQFPNSWQLKAPTAQLQQEKVVIEGLEGYQGQWKIQSPEAEIDLKHEQLSGKHLQIQHPHWQIKAQHFKSKIPLKQWSLQQVYAKFES